MHQSFFNYKGFHSIVLLGIISHDYRFLAHDIGCQGRISDGGVWANTKLCKNLKEGNIPLPKARKLPQPDESIWEQDDTMPFVLVGDSAFPLTTHMMKPFPEKSVDDRKRIFNYRLSRLRRVSENAFGILASRFRIFHTTIDLHPQIATIVVSATVALHNMLCMKSRNTYNPPGFADEVSDVGDVADGEWRNEDPLTVLAPLPPQNCPLNATQIREKFADYFCGPGEVEWQWNTLL